MNVEWLAASIFSFAGTWLFYIQTIQSVRDHVSGYLYKVRVTSVKHFHFTFSRTVPSRCSEGLFDRGNFGLWNPFISHNENVH